ncbi:MAG: DinB family protein [Trueperaceae bacterium]|nr:DinB family protein [Trueperaceae bacterium]
MSEADKVLRREVVALLEKGQAHVTVEYALEGLEPHLRAVRPPEQHSVWEVLEHMRIAQHDIIRYTLDPDYNSPPWPKGYWPDLPDTLNEAQWRDTVDGFYRGRDEAISLAHNTDIVLTDEIPYGEGRTYLRQLLLVADHNAYHLGQIVTARRALASW